MEKRTLANLLLLATLIAVIFFGCVTIQSLERLHRSNLQLLEQLKTVPAPSVAPERAAGAAGEIANARFFAPQAPVGGKLVQAISAEPPNLNPIICNEATAAELAALCSATLAERDWENFEKFVPMLATEWEISPDHREFRIKLRKNVFFHDYVDPDTGKLVKGVEVTAEDFKFFIDVIRDEAVNAAPLRVHYRDLEAIEIINPHEFIVRWKRPFYGAVALTLGLSPLPRFFYWNYPGKFDGSRFNNDHLRNQMIVNCGPYRLESYERDRKIVFRRNENYFGNPLGVGAKLETIEFEIIKHPNTRFQALLGGKINMLGLTPDQWVSRRDELNKHQINCHRYLSSAYSYIGYNQKNPLFRAKEVRQALTMLVDREKIARELYHDLAEIVTSPFFPGSKYYDQSLKPWHYDVKAARKLLAKSGWRDLDGDGILEKDGRKFSFTMLQVANHPIQQRMLPMLKESFAAAGIEMKIQTVEWSVYIQRLNDRNYDACTLGWSSSFDSDLYQVWHSSQIANGGSNHIGYANPELDALLERMQTTFDLAERQKIAREIGEILHEEQPYTFLFCPYSLTAIDGRYQNVRVFSFGIPEILFYLP